MRLEGDFTGFTNSFGIVSLIIFINIFYNTVNVVSSYAKVVIDSIPIASASLTITRSI